MTSIICQTSVCALLVLSCGLLAPPSSLDSTAYVFFWLATVSDHLHCFFECRTMERHRHGGCREDFDYPPMDAGGFSPSPHPPPWLEPPPPYEVAIKTTCSSTHLRRSYSDTHLASEPLFGRSREISFEVWCRPAWAPPLDPLNPTLTSLNRHKTADFPQNIYQKRKISITEAWVLHFYCMLATSCPSMSMFLIQVQAYLWIYE